MRLAVIADIHGNVAALEAVLADVKARGADGIVNLGDCVSGPLWPRETMDLLESVGAADRARQSRPLGCRDCAREHVPVRRLRLRPAHTGATHGSGGPAARGWTWATAYPPCTARQADDNQYLLEDIVAGALALAKPEAIAERLGAIVSGVLLCAHSHQPRVAHGPGGLLIVNPGSVGCPAYADPTPPSPHVSETGSPHARYALLAREDGRWRVDLIAIEYDWDRASACAAANGRPEWARALATGYVS